jgi:hypothetical protein
MKLQRDRVTSDGNKVGVYDAYSDGSEVLFECDVELADEIVRLWNGTRRYIVRSDQKPRRWRYSLAAAEKAGRELADAGAEWVHIEMVAETEWWYKGGPEK